MSVAVIVATYGERCWYDLAKERAIPSAVEQAPELVIVHEPAGSLATARNIGARRAVSPTLVFLDADDELAPGYVDALTSARSALSAPGMVGGDLRRGPCLLVPRVQVVAGEGLSEPRFPNRTRPMEELNHCVIGTAVPRRTFFKVGGFRDDLPIYEDWALFLACKRAGARLVDVPGAVYRVHESGDGRNQPNRPGAYETYWKIRDEHEAAISRRTG